MSRTREEHDSMGTLKVPEEALYGAQTQRAVNNFPISHRPMPRAFLRALALVKSAAAQANHALGHLEAATAQAIMAHAQEVAQGDHDAHFPVDVFQTGSGTSTNMNMNEVLATLASRSTGQKVHPNDHVNYGQSSNDVIPTALHVSASLVLHEQLLPALDHLVDVVEAQQKKWGHLVKTGRTHLMDAMPLTVRQEWGAFVAQLRKGQTRLQACVPHLHQLAQGGTAIGTGINAPEGFSEAFCRTLSQSTQLDFVPNPNLLEGIATQDTAVELAGALNTLAVSLTKIANDIRWMNSGPLAGLGELTLPAVQPGSSIMPGKVNPVLCEALLMVCAQVMGHHTAITIAGQSGTFQLNVMLPLIAHNLIDSMELLAHGMRAFADKALAGVCFHEAALAEALAKNPILITALNHVIGYEQGAALAKQAYQEGRSVFDVAQELTDLSDEELHKHLDPRRLTCDPEV